MRLGLIGLGRIGAFHAETLTAPETVAELLITVPGTAETRGDELRATIVATATDLLVLPIHGVLIASSTPTHLDLIRAAVRAGLPAFREKPVAEDPYAAKDLPALVEGAGVQVQIGFPRRFDPAFLRATAAVDAGDLGWLTTVRSTTMDPAPPPAAYVAASGGIFGDCSIHDLDTARWVTGREVVEAYAVGGTKGDPFIRDADDVDSASILFTFDDDTIGVVSNTRCNGRSYDVRLELHGSKDSIAAGLDDGRRPRGELDRRLSDEDTPPASEASHPRRQMPTSAKGWSPFRIVWVAWTSHSLRHTATGSAPR